MKPLAPGNIPDELKALHQWVLWKYETRNGKQTKVPYRVKDLQIQAESNNPQTWGTYHAALNSYHRDLADGIGFVFSPDDPYCGIDLDKCIDIKTGEISSRASDIIKVLDSYTELSPSKTGIHIIVEASLADLSGRRKGNIEMYDQGRYFTMTGDTL